MSKFSNRLIGLREEKNLSKTTVAKKLGLSVQRYANWEYGTREPDLENLKAIAKLFDVSIDYLTGQTDSRKNKSTVSDADLEDMLDNARSFSGKPMSDHDREIIKTYLKGYYSAK